MEKKPGLTFGADEMRREEFEKFGGRRRKWTNDFNLKDEDKVYIIVVIY